MINIRIVQCAIEEIKNRNFGVMEEFMKIHEVVYQDGKPKIERVDDEKEDGTGIIYFPVKNEKFYLAIYVNTVPEIAVAGVDIESNNCVYFKAYSDMSDANELSLMTRLKPTSIHNKRDKKKFGNGYYKNSVIRFEPNPEPDEFEDKLKKLLDFLEQDKEGIARLVDKANGFIQVVIIAHNGNTMLGGPHIDNESIQRMGALNLGIDFDLYAEGNKWK